MIMSRVFQVIKQPAPGLPVYCLDVCHDVMVSE